MFVEGFGEILTTLLTTNPELSAVPAASSILDTSNYTFHAITYGKDAQGFDFHAHSISSTQHVNGDSASAVSGYNDDSVIAINFINTAPFVSSYHASSYHLKYASTYNSLPIYPAPNHTRLELASTKTNNASSFSGEAPNLGHYPNSWVDSTLSNAWTILGGFSPPSSAGKKYVLTDSNGSVITSGVLSGMYNHFNLADKNGYVKVSQVTGLDSVLGATQGAELSGGPVVFSSASIDPNLGLAGLAVVPQRGDAVTLALYGGVNHIGVYCLDIGKMLASGITPPYSWNALNNNSIYKLVAKVSFWDNILAHEDFGTIAGLEFGYNSSLLTNDGPTFKLKFSFL